MSYSVNFMDYQMKPFPELSKMAAAGDVTHSVIDVTPGFDYPGMLNNWLLLGQQPEGFIEVPKCWEGSPSDDLVLDDIPMCVMWWGDDGKDILFLSSSLDSDGV